MSNEKKSDWSFIDSMRSKADAETETRSELVPASGQLLPNAEERGPGSLANVPREEPELPEGILARFQAKAVSRRAALDALKVNYDFQIDSLKHNLSRALQVSNAKADTMAEEFLMELDAQHLTVLGKLGLRNKETRERVLMELTDSTVNTIRELQGKDWPQQFIEDAINQSMKLRERAINEIMRDIGGQD